MDSIGILIKLLKQLDLINIVSSESLTSCSLLLVQTLLLQSGKMPALLPVAQRLLRSSWPPTGWAGACSPHFNMEGFPWQRMHMWMDPWLNGTDLTYSRAQWGSIKPLTFSVSCGFILWLDAQIFFLPILTTLEVISLCPSYYSLSSEEPIWMGTLLKDILLKNSATGRNKELGVPYSMTHGFLDTTASSANQNII